MMEKNRADWIIAGIRARRPWTNQLDNERYLWLVSTLLKYPKYRREFLRGISNEERKESLFRALGGCS
jgi:tRNA(His) 5'-end guanylyltransferase